MKKNPPMSMVFVYGTLKRGRGNNRVLNEGKAEFVGEAITRNKYLFYDRGIPFLAHLPDEAKLRRTLGRFLTPVWGEVWRIDPVSLAACDRLEGHPTFYARERIDVKITPPDAPGRTHYAKPWAYFVQHLPDGLPEAPKKAGITWPTNMQYHNRRTDNVSD